MISFGIKKKKIQRKRLKGNIYIYIYKFSSSKLSFDCCYIIVDDTCKSSQKKVKKLEMEVGNEKKKFFF